MAKKVSVIDIIKTSFNYLFKQNSFLIIAFINFVLMLPSIILINMIGIGPNLTNMSLNSLDIIASYGWLFIIFSIIQPLFSMLSVVFYIQGTYYVKSRKKIHFKELFKESLRKFPKFFLGMILIALIFGGILLLSVFVPIIFILSLIATIVFYLLIFYYPVELILTNNNIINSLKKSYNIGKNHIKTTIIYWLLLLLISLLLMIVPFVNLLAETIIIQPITSIGMSLLYIGFRKKK